MSKETATSGADLETVLRPEGFQIGLRAEDEAPLGYKLSDKVPVRAIFRIAPRYVRDPEIQIPLFSDSACPGDRLGRPSALRAFLSPNPTVLCIERALRSSDMFAITSTMPLLSVQWLDTAISRTTASEHLDWITWLACTSLSWVKRCVCLSQANRSRCTVPCTDIVQLLLI